MLKLVFFVCIVSATLFSKSNRDDIEELIIGGKPIVIEEVPYQVGLYYRIYFFCSGSILSTTHVVSAAHCLVFLVKPTQSLTVRVGSSKMYRGGKTIHIKKISVHPKFSLRTTDYDVGIIELKTPLKYSCSIQPIKLSEKEPLDGQEVRVSGWGSTWEIGPPSRQLRSVVVRVVGKKVCEENYKNRTMVTSRMICAASENKDACFGDSGGPLVWRDKLVGIVSTGEGCARKDFPGIYTNVVNSEIRNFIKKESGLC